MQGDDWLMLAIGIFIGAWLWPAGNSTYEDAPYYYMTCSDFEHNPLECPVKVYVSRIDYKVSTERQYVVGSIDYPYKSCVVYDSKNWACKTASGSTDRMSDGSLRNSEDAGSIGADGAHSILPRHMSVGWLEYWIRNIRAQF